jgi:hypothetical protein
MPSSDHGTVRRLRNSWVEPLAEAERDIEAIVFEIGERAAWCTQLERVGLQVVKKLYRKP